jgi:hypothetical protein
MGRIADRVPANLGFKAPHSDATSSKDNRAPLLAVRLDAGHASLQSVGEEADKLACIRALALRADLFADLPSKVLLAFGGALRPRTCTSCAAIRRRRANLAGAHGRQQTTGDDTVLLVPREPLRHIPARHDRPPAPRSADAGSQRWSATAARRLTLRVTRYFALGDTNVGSGPMSRYGSRTIRTPNPRSICQGAHASTTDTPVWPATNNRLR